MLRLAEELLLLLLDEDTGEFPQLPDRTIGYALIGAILIDLCFEGRLDSDIESLILVDSNPVGDDLLDPTLAQIAEEMKSRDSAPPPDIDFWLRRLVNNSYEWRDNALNGLVEKGILETDDGRAIFSLSPRVQRTRRYPIADADSDRAIHDRVMNVIFSDEIPSPDEIAIISLANACNAFQRILNSDEFEQVKERIELVSRLDLIGQSVANAVRNLSVAEAEALRRSALKHGGGWPIASRRLPFLGHALHLAGDLRTYLIKQYRKHGPIFEVQVPGKRIVVMAGQEANLFMIRRGRQHFRAPDMFKGFINELGSPRVIMGSDGADHAQLRKATRNAYSRNFILSRLPEAVELIDRELEELRPSDSVHALKFSKSIVNEQICQLTGDISSREYLDAASIFLDSLLQIYFLQQRPKLMMRLPKQRQARRKLEEAFEKMIASHDSALRPGADRDVVDDLLELHTNSPEFMGHQDLFPNVIAPFLLGIDTVASSVGFMLYAVLKDPELVERIRDEADELFNGDGDMMQGIRKMTVTQYAVLETLRMYPIVPATLRKVINAFDFEGYHVPSGNEAMIALSVPHFLEEFYSDPERFDVDRFSPERRESSKPGIFAPFGLGHHACLGQGFAQVQMVLIIARILHRAEFALDPPQYRLKIDNSITPRPHNRFKIRLMSWRQ